MVNIKINGTPYQVEENTSILDAASMAGIRIPTLCYMKEINKIGACRVCLVEIEGRDQLFASCDNVCTEGLSIITNSAKVMDARRTNLELLLSQHKVE
jgi:NADH-quinone oxidoreductase subunit G